MFNIPLHQFDFLFLLFSKWSCSHVPAYGHETYSFTCKFCFDIVVLPVDLSGMIRVTNSCKPTCSQGPNLGNFHTEVPASLYDANSMNFPCHFCKEQMQNPMKNTVTCTNRGCGYKSGRWAVEYHEKRSCLFTTVLPIESVLCKQEREVLAAIDQL